MKEKIIEKCICYLLDEKQKKREMPYQRLLSAKMPFSFSGNYLYIKL